MAHSIPLVSSQFAHTKIADSASIPGGDGSDIQATCFSSRRSVRRIQPRGLMHSYDIHCHKAKSRFTRFMTSLFSLGRVRYRNIKVNMGDGQGMVKVAVNITKLGKQYKLEPTQREALLRAKSAEERTKFLAGILEQKIRTEQALVDSAKPMKNESSADWTSRVLREHAIYEGNNYCQQCITLELSPDQAGYYHDLQKAIAERLPQESHRPTIDLTIRGSKVQSQGAKFSLGVLGGVGPISDSVIVQQTFENLTPEQAEHVQVNVFSCPPPRTKSEMAKSLADYGLNMQRFSSRKELGAYVVASNTAHVNLNMLKEAMGFGDRMHNMVAEVAGQIQRDNPEGVLVLGTSMAYSKDMYPKQLDIMGVKPVRVQPAGKQDDLQKIIDRTKRKGNDSEREQLYQFAVKQIDEYKKQSGEKVSHVLLGCTELPMALGEEGMRKLEKDTGVKIVDTEAVFARAYATMLRNKSGDLKGMGRLL
ncbi:aspartate/glutamate racemase family protein [Endozoicomonadaceae bacterium StTr2]